MHGAWCFIPGTVVEHMLYTIIYTLALMQHVLCGGTLIIKQNIIVKIDNCHYVRIGSGLFLFVDTCTWVR